MPTEVIPSLERPGKSCTVLDLAVRVQAVLRSKNWCSVAANKEQACFFDEE